MIYKDFILNNDIWNFLINLKQRDRIPNALLFHGNSGAGKEATAIEFAAYINCEQKLDESACGECSSCSRIKNNNYEYIDYIFPLPRGKITSKKDSIDKSFTEKTLAEYSFELREKLENPFHEIAINGANTILINSIRDIKKKLFRSTDQNIQKIVIIFESEKLCHPNQEAANSLLKILEEPPSNSTFILVSSKGNLLLDTIKSRCIEVFFQKISSKQFSIYNSIDSSNIDLYKLVGGNIKYAKKITEDYVYQLEDFIKTHHTRTQRNSKNIDLKLISYMSKLFKSDIFLFKIFIKGLKHYYKDILNLKLDKEGYRPTFEFLNNYDSKHTNKKTFNCINMIEDFESDMSIKLNLELSLFNLFDNLNSNK